MKHYIDPTVDCVFKAILGSHKHIKLLLHFLNSVVDFVNPITSLTIENPYSSKDHLDAKMHIVDIKARDSEGRTYQIELQLTSPKHLPSRMLHNLCQIHSDQIRSGEDYGKIAPTISIWLLTNDIEFDNDYKMTQDDVKFHFTLCDMEKGARISQDISLYVINLHRWQKPEHLSEIDYWLYFLNEGGNWKELPEDAQIPQLMEAMKVLEEFSEKEESFLVYQSRLAASIAARSEEAERKQMREENKQMAAENEQMAAENQQIKSQLENMVIELLKANNLSIEKIATMSGMSIEQVRTVQSAQIK